MSARGSNNPNIHVVVTLSLNEKANANAFAKCLEDQGFIVDQIMTDIGLIIGTGTEDTIATLAHMDGVLAVESNDSIRALPVEVVPLSPDDPYL